MRRTLACFAILALAACDEPPVPASAAPDGAPDAEPPPTEITGTVSVRDRATGVEAAVDLSSAGMASVTARVRLDDGTTVELDAEGRADGTFAVSDVPAGAVQLSVQHAVHGTVHCQSESRVFHVVLSSGSGARQLPANPDATGLQVAVDNLVPWEIDDTLDIAVEQFGLQLENVGASDDGALVPAAGATSFEFTSTGWHAELIDSSLGDVAFLLQRREVAGAKAVIAGAELPPFTMTTDTITSLSASLAPLEGNHVQAFVAASAFIALAEAAQAAGIPDPAEASTYATLTAGRIALVSASGLTSDLALDTEYGDPMPPGLERVLTVSSAALLADAPAARTAVRIPLADVGQGMSILPRVGAVRDILIGDGLNPLVSWSAPTLGAPALYTVGIFIGRHEIATVMTDGTTCFIPPGVLSPYQPYRLAITAWVGDRLPDAWDVSARAAAETTSVTAAFVPE